MTGIVCVWPYRWVTRSMAGQVTHRDDDQMRRRASGRPFRVIPRTPSIVSRRICVIFDRGDRRRGVTRPLIAAYSSFELKNLMITSKQSLDSGTSGL